jgi:hypothetical protein
MTLSGYKSVSQLYLSNDREIYSVNDKMLCGVAEHRVLLTNGKYRKLCELEPGDKIVKNIDDTTIQFILSTLGIKDFEELFEKEIEVSDELLPIIEKFFTTTR